MTPLRLARPRTPAPWLRRLAGLRVPGGGRVLAGTLLLAWALLCALLALVPRGWLVERIERDQQAWFAQARNNAIRLTQEWEHWTAQVPDFARGDEPAVQAWLAREALVEAVVDLREGCLWLREGDRLRRPAIPAEAERPAMLVRKAIEACSLGEVDPRTGEAPRIPGIAGREGMFSGSWWPIPTLIIRREEAPMIVAFERRWALVKHWTTGSPQVERWLKGTLRPQDDYRFGVSQRGSLAQRPFDSFPPPAQTVGPWTPEARNLGEAPYFLERSMAQSFSANSTVILQMTPATYQRLWLTHRLRTRLAWAAYGLGVGLSGLALAFYILSRHRDRVRAERTAALAHSLKTPLAVLQSRCDTVLNLDLPEETRQAHLLHIGQEVRHLTRLIEAGLEETRPGGECIGPAFLEALDEELAPAFEAQGRAFGVYASDLDLRAPASELRTALVTLLENALRHGTGAVELRVVQAQGLARFVVQDEGPGIAPDLLGALQADADLPATLGAGQRMGLRMLARFARDQGWGLCLENLQPGFRATLELP